ncbi:hypothetical protein [Streptomyces stackebrandtii]|uniref:hypothetical protein n=1 Tax=Streptomyces stackebrandtii TaxID=3051177 RepID=UPI0028DCCDC9|nr:hypothetical protein [Streptomyces sp. DSM 40976]
MTPWVDRIVGATGWQPRDIQLSWTATEEALGVELPGDFKELCATRRRDDWRPVTGRRIGPWPKAALIALVSGMTFFWAAWR